MKQRLGGYGKVCDGNRRVKSFHFLYGGVLMFRFVVFLFICLNDMIVRSILHILSMACDSTLTSVVTHDLIVLYKIVG